MNARLLSLLALALLSACVLPPKGEPRGTPIDTTALGLSGAEHAAAREAWWQDFGDPQLDALIERALAHNPSLAEALARVDAAQAQAYAAGAGNLPSGSIDGEAVRQRLSETFYIPPPYAGSVRWLGQLGVNLGWDLDFWGKQARLLDLAQGSAAAARLDAETARLALAGSLAQAYVDLHRAYALGDVAERAVAQREALLQLTQSRVSAGLDTDLERHNAEALLPQARAAKLQADAARELAVHRLAALSGRGADAYAGIARPQLKLDAALSLPHELPLDLLARRPDVLAAQARINAAGAGREAAHAAFYPDISLRAFVGYQAIGIDKLVQGDSAVWGAGPALHLPIFDARRLKGAYRGATAEVDAAIAKYNETVLDAVRQVADQLSLSDALTRQLAEARQRSDAAEAAFRLAQRRYEAGLSSQLVVLNAESQVLDARRELVSLNAALAVARVTLLLTLGGSFDPQIQTVLAGVSS